MAGGLMRMQKGGRLLRAQGGRLGSGVRWAVVQRGAGCRVEVVSNRPGRDGREGQGGGGHASCHGCCITGRGLPGGLSAAGHAGGPLLRRRRSACHCARVFRTGQAAGRRGRCRQALLFREEFLPPASHRGACARRLCQALERGAKTGNGVSQHEYTPPRHGRRHWAWPRGALLRPGQAKGSQASAYFWGGCISVRRRRQWVAAHGNASRN